MSAKLPLILLPPSEGKAAGGEGPPWSSGTMTVDLDQDRAVVMAALVRAMRAPAAQRAKLLGVKGVALDAATEADRQVAGEPTLPAIERYTGVLYDALDHRTLERTARRRLDRSVLIFSGLWGLVGPADPIPDYKLKMGAALPGLGRLSTWWRPRITDALCRLTPRRRVWNLLPQEHAAAWAPDPVPDQYRVTFLERRSDGRLVAVAHWNKLLKGALVRHLLAHPQAGPEELAAWDHPAGYRLDPDRTARDGSVTELVFVQR